MGYAAVLILGHPCMGLVGGIHWRRGWWELESLLVIPLSLSGGIIMASTSPTSRNSRVRDMVVGLSVTVMLFLVSMVICLWSVLNSPQEMDHPKNSPQADMSRISLTSDSLPEIDPKTPVT